MLISLKRLLWEATVAGALPLARGEIEIQKQI